MPRPSQLAILSVVVSTIGACANDRRPYDFNAQASAGSAGKLAATGEDPLDNGGGSAGDTGQSNGGAAGRTGTGGTTAGIAGASGAEASGGAGSPISICQLPIDPGECTDLSPSPGYRFAFDSSAGRCERFVFAPCGGNANQFETLDACIEACDPSGLDRCDVSADCTLKGPSCCALCEPAQKSNYTAVNHRYARVNACSMFGVACGACAEYAGLPTSQNFAATCVTGRCEVYDIREEPESTCDSDNDCRPRRGLDCCEDCASDVAWVAVNVNAQVGQNRCSTTSNCTDCGAPTPNGMAARCTAGHCAMVAVP